MKTAPQYDILLIEENFIHRTTLERLLTESGYKVKTTDSAEKALNLVKEGFGCVVTGVISGNISQSDLIKRWKEYFPETPVPLIHETQSVKSLVEAIHPGEDRDPSDAAAVHVMVMRMMELVRACQQDMKAALPENVDGSRDNIVGHSPLMKNVFKLIDRSSRAFSTVLILGESGTGKDLTAQAIHRNSPRKAGPFVAFNCAAVPDTLVESELFGYEKGTFTGSSGTKMGLFEASNGGTLFIDEIGDCALPIQAKLLRVLENRIVTPLGGHREIKVDTRVVVATSRDLPDMVAKGTFREDLYYRLNIITIRMPPLRDRREDIALLVAAFIKRVNVQSRSSIDAISVQALEALQHYNWPGNVRQLLNVIERAMVLADKANTKITLDDLPPEVRNDAAALPQQTADALNHPPGVSITVPFHRPTDPEGASLTLDQLERQAIQAALDRFHNNRTKAAQAIGISVRTLQRKLSQHELPDVVLFRTKSDP